MKASVFGVLLRVFFVAFGDDLLSSDAAGWPPAIAGLAAVTMIVGNLAAIVQKSVKRMLAYSSIAHAGYLLMGVVAGTTRGVAAMMIYLVVYSFMQLGAFAIIIMMRRRDVIGDDLKDFSGLHTRQPLAAFAMLIFMLSLGGIPPTAGFMGKLWIFGAAIDAGYIWLAVIGVINSALSLYYYVRVVVFMWITEGEAGPAFRLSPAVAAVLVVAVAGTVALGVYPRLLFDFAAASASSLGATAVVGLK